MSDLNQWEKEIVTCTLCGYCKAVCPSFRDIGWDSSSARGRIILSYGILEGEIDADESVVERLYQCTTCRDCWRRCPSKIKVDRITEAARMVLMEAELGLEAHKRVCSNIMMYGNPFGEEKSRLENFGKKPKKAEIGYFMGCLSGYRELGIANSVLSILEKLGVDYTVIDEVCCGSVIQRVGWKNDDLKKLIVTNLERIEDLGVEKVLFSCAGCYRMFKEEYPKFTELEFEVQHVTEFLADLDMELKEMRKKVSYHDPCHLGRHVGVYDAPRDLIKKIPNIEFIELANSRETAKCCGGGGGVRAAYPELAQRIASRRVEEAKNVEILLTSCPFCVNNLRKGEEIAKTGVEIFDTVEVINQLL